MDFDFGLEDHGKDNERHLAGILNILKDFLSLLIDFYFLSIDKKQDWELENILKGLLTLGKLVLGILQLSFSMDLLHTMKLFKQVFTFRDAPNSKCTVFYLFIYFLTVHVLWTNEKKKKKKLYS